jgi:hypothetical protein
MKVPAKKALVLAVEQALNCVIGFQGYEDWTAKRRKLQRFAK